MIETLKLFIKNKTNEDVEILSIFKTGSHLFCENCKDKDYVVIVDKPILRLKYRDTITNTDYFIYSKSERQTELEFNINNQNCIYVINELFKPTTTIYGDATVNLDLFNKEYEYKEMLRNILPKRFFSKRIRWENYETYCHNKFWWILLGLMFINNKSYEVTNDLKNIIQLCHDGKLPKYWETWVKEQLEIK